MTSGALPFVLQKTHFSSSSGFQVIADAIKSCISTSDTMLGNALHSHVIRQGHKSCQCILKSLLNMYAKCKAFEETHKLFGEISCHDTVTWNILLSGFAVSRNHDAKMMDLFNLLHAAQNPKPSPVTLAIVLPVCIRSGMLSAGISIHGYAIKSGMGSQTLVGNAFVSMYAKCGLVSDASAVFHGIAEKDVVSYNALIAGFSENKLFNNAFQVFHSMLKGPVVPNYATTVNILPICASLGDSIGYNVGRQIHCYVLRRTEIGKETTVDNALLSFYLRIGRIKEAKVMFQRMKTKDLVSWNSMIAGYASNGEWLKALLTFRELVDLDMMDLDSVTLLTILPVCAQLGHLHIGEELHGYVFRHPTLLENTSIGNALIRFYAKCGCIEASSRAFAFIRRKDLISWNSMLDAFGVNLMETKFSELLRQMVVGEVKLDAVTLITVLQFSATFFQIRNVKETHGFALRSCLLLGDNEPTLANALLDAYVKCQSMDYASILFENLFGTRNVVTCNSLISGYLACGSHDDANMIFKSMSEKDITTWNLMVRGYAVNECSTEALSLFYELQDYGNKPDAMTIMSILPVSGQMASVHMVRQCHGYVVRSCFEDVHLNAALLDVYSKCGSISSASKLYLSTHRKDLVVFTAMLGGYAMHGLGKQAIQVFDYMIECGVKPDHVVLTAVLSACRHAGLVNEGLTIFNSINEVYFMKPSMEQYACVVDLLGRGGRIKEAFSFVKQMPVTANANIWGTLLGACKTHHDVDMGHVVSNHLRKIETCDIGNYVVMSNLYAADARWDGVMEMRRLINAKDLKKPAGCSWIEVGDSKNVFVAGDYFHPNRDLIYNALRNLDKQIKEQDEMPHV